MNRTSTIAALLLAAGTVSSSHAAILAWDSNLSGNASNANNWNPGQVPTATDELHFLDGVFSGNYTVTYDSLVPQSLRHFYRGDEVGVRITNAAGHLTGSIDIENNGSAYLEQGLLVVSGNVGVGHLSASGGHLTVDASTLRLPTTGTSIRGLLGPASVRVTAGGTIDATNADLNLDPDPGLTSTLLIDLASSATFRNVLLGQTSGLVATVDASTLTVNDNLNLAGVATGDGQLVIRSTSAAPSRLAVGDQISIAANTTGAAAGAGILQISGAAASVTCNRLLVGDPQGGSALVRLSANSRLTCATANFLGAGFLDLDLGELTCTDQFAHAAPLTIDGGSSLFVHGSISTGSSLIVGDAAEGVVSKQNSGFGTYQSCIIGNLSGSSGNISLQGGQNTFQQALTVGNAGSANFVATVGTTAVCNGPLNIGLSASGSGLVRTVGDSLLTATAGLGVGGSPTASGGTGTLRAEIGGDVNVSGLFRVWANGTVQAMSSGVVNSASTIDLRPGGVAQVNNGTISGPAIVLTGSSSAAGTGATLTGTGLISGNISGTGFGNLITPTGDLTIGNSASTFGFDSTNITTNVGAQLLTLLDRNAAVVGNTTIAAGTLSAPNGITVASTKSISGGGTIDAPSITLLGGINATTPQGFVIRGIATGAGGLTGTLFDFSNTGGFTGAGNIDSQIRGAAGSVITATGNLSLGTNSSVGFSFDGTLRTNANQVTLHDTGTAFVGDIEMAGGTVFCTDTDMTSDIGDVTSGFGTIATSGRTWITAGTIRPSGAGADATGQIGSFGNVNMENIFNSSVLDMQIGGTAASDIDKFAVLGALTLDGTLRVRFVPGYTPAGGEVYTIVTASSMTGAFTTLDLPPRTILITNPTSIQIGALCPADYNGDGGVDGDDVIDFFAAWDAGDPAADFNGDEGVDGDDAIAFFEHWDAGC